MAREWKYEGKERKKQRQGTIQKLADPNQPSRGHARGSRIRLRRVYLEKLKPDEQLPSQTPPA